MQMELDNRCILCKDKTGNNRDETKVIKISYYLVHKTEKYDLTGLIEFRSAPPIPNINV